MPTIAPIQEPWSDVSRKFVRHQKLPHGTELVLEHKPSGARRRPRKARADRKVARQRFAGRAEDNTSLARMFERYLFPALVEKLDTRRFGVKLVGPNGEPSSGQMLVKTVRSWPPLPTLDELEQAEANRAVVEEIADVVVAQIREHEYLSDYEQVQDGYALAMVRRYGVEEVFEAVRKAARDVK